MHKDIERVRQGRTNVNTLIKGASFEINTLDRVRAGEGAVDSSDINQGLTHHITHIYIYTYYIISAYYGKHQHPWVS